MLSRVERGAFSLVAKNDIWVEVRVQVFDASLQRLNLALERRRALSGRIVGALATGPVGSVAVDVHVGVLSAISTAVDEDGSLNVAAVLECFRAAAVGEAAGKLVAACSGLCGV